MRGNEFQELCHKTAIHGIDEGKPEAISYCVIGLCGEAGEIANKWKKVLRGDPKAFKPQELAAEIGDLLWYAAELAIHLGYPLDVIMSREIAKVQERKAREMLRGEGDYR